MQIYKKNSFPIKAGVKGSIKVHYLLVESMHISLIVLSFRHLSAIAPA